MAIEDYIDQRKHRYQKERREKSERHPGINTAHRKAEGIFNDRKYSIQAPDFIEHYGQEVVLDDMRELLSLKEEFKRIETPFKKETKKASDVFEAIFVQQSHDNGWLGDDAVVMKTSGYDDVKNGIDLIAEYENEREESNVLAMGVDVTFGMNSIREKFEKIKEKLDRGELARIKYFKDRNGDHIGERCNIPRVIIGASRKEVNNLAEQWNKDESVLANHAIQTLILDQLLTQVTHIKEYAESGGHETAARAYRRTLRSLEEMIAAKKEIIPATELQNDPVHKEILAVVKEVFS